MTSIMSDSKSKVEQLEKDLGPLEWTSVSLASAAGGDRGNLLSDGSNRWVIMVKQNPLILVGMVMTCGVFARGMRHYYFQDSVKQNHMMRARIGAQFATLACMVAGVTYAGWKNTRETLPEKSPEKPLEKSPEKPVEKPPEKSSEKSPEKS